MAIARSVLVSLLAVGLVVTLSRVSLGHGGSHGSHGGGEHSSHAHEGHHEEHHESHHEGHHEEHHEGHHEGHHEEHHEEHHDAHHEGHHDDHHDDHHDAHHEGHHDDHHDGHDGHHDDHHEAHHDDHHGFDHRDWYQHAWWHHHPTWHNHPWQHWWHHPTVNEIGVWSAGWGLGAPFYYAYGPGGNVVYQNDQVYVNGAAVGTADAYDNTAIALANARPATDASSDPSGDWMPLGTFALLRNADDTEPSQTLQLALSKNGSLSGVLFDLPKDTATPVRGSLDRATQRVAFDLGAQSGLVAETGLYNLTQDKVTLLIHKSGAKPRTYTLVRFQTPPTGADLALSPK